MGSEHRFINITMTDVLGLLERAEEVLTREDFEQLKALVETLIELTRLVRQKGSTIARLRRLVGLASSERAADVLAKEGDAGQMLAGKQYVHSSQRKRKGHGRTAASAYKAATHISVGHESLAAGCTCPSCERGKLYPFAKPAHIVRIFGQPPLAANCWDIERLRCNGCGEVFTAQPPPEARGAKYDETAVTMMALLRYGAGMPLNRLQRLQSELETPLPASTQWDVVSKAVRLMIPVYDALFQAAADGSLVHNDDTYIRVLDLMGRRRDKLRSAGKLDAPERTGLFTTAIISHTEHGPIALFFSGRNHAGENLTQLLDSRATDLSPPILMCDALNRNLPKGYEVIEANCLCHGRRHVLDEVAGFPQESRHILESLAKVFHNESICRAKGLTDEQRLLFHQNHSRSLMDDLEEWMNAQLSEKRVEPNSGMGQALTYLLKRWDKLTLFLTVPGAPLENNICERALKMAIAHRKNSLFYRSLHGANVGDIYMTIIYTARLHGVNPFDYLNALQRHAADVAKNPSNWLPWSYQASLEHLLQNDAA